jgi:glycosyltransferase involved in cell wall biosynthesis
LDTEDLHCLRKTRHQALKQGINFQVDQLLSSEIAKREIAAIYRCDLSLIISSYEMELLQETFGIHASLLCHLPFFIHPIDIDKQQSWKPFEDRQHFVSIGNFLHAPNVDATLQLKHHIWKLIRKQIPNAELHIYGAYPTQRVLQLNNEKEGFFVHGFATNAKEVIENSRVLLAPLRFGAGIKGKLTDAMECGTPSVTTQIGVEGMHQELPWNGFVTNDWNEFAEKAVELYSQKDPWIQAQQNGIEIINQLYAKRDLEAKLLKVIDTQFQNLTALRTQNFIGQMLQHHSLKSTKYLSKWIEEKNRP